MTKGINIKFPFEETTEGGVFATNKITELALSDDLVALLTLKRGQRPMQGNMYSPIYDYLHEPMDNITESELKTKIEEKVDEFLPQIVIKKIIFTQKNEESLLEIKIKFNIEETFGTEQTVNINVPFEENALI